MRIASIAAATLSASLVLITAHSPARAERVCIAITAQVAVAEGIPVGVNVGDTITGTYVYESTTLDTNDSPTGGGYRHTTAPFGITLYAGAEGIVFRTDPQNVDFSIGINNGHESRDNYLLRSYNNIFEKTVPSATSQHISWQLDDPTATALVSDELPTGPPILADWQSIFGLMIDSRNDLGDRMTIQAHVTTASRFLDDCPPPPLVFHLRGTGATANPLSLPLDDNGPVSTTAKYKDSGVVNLAGGNPWKEVGTWVAEPGTTGTLVVRDLRVWLGLRNSDDQGTNFDLRAEVLKNGSLVGSGETYCITGITRNPSSAKTVLLAFDPSPVNFTSTTDVLSLRVLARIGTDGASLENS